MASLNNYFSAFITFFIMLIFAYVTYNMFDAIVGLFGMESLEALAWAGYVMIFGYLTLVKPYQIANQAG